MPTSTEASWLSCIIGRPAWFPKGSACAAGALLLMVGAVPGQAAPVPARIFAPAGYSVPEGTSGSRAPARGFVLDAGAAEAFRTARGGRLRLPVDGGEVHLELRPFDVLAPAATVTATGDRGVTRVAPEVALFRGEVIGAPGSRAVLSFSPRGVLGIVEWGTRRIGVGPVRAAGVPGVPGLHAIGDAAAPPHTDFRCGAEELDGAVDAFRRGLSPERARPDVTPQGTGRRWCDLAVDCDWEYFSVRHGGNLGEAIDYALTLVGVVSTIYETDIDVSVRVSHLNVWTTSSDPYSASTLSTQLNEFEVYCHANWQNVSRHLAHLFSGRSIGGGIAWISGLCFPEDAFGCSQIDGIYQYPTSQTTWDAYVVAHELGHNFNSLHTFNCAWQQAGFAPPGALLDSCRAAEGSCYTGPTGIVPPDRGTIMSYCHLLGPINSVVRLEFHAACKIVMRERAELCLPEGAFDPRVNLSASASGFSVDLSWSPSPVPGVIRYDVYRSGTSLDTNPALAGSTTGTAFTDEGRVGTYFYRVRAVRESDQSVFGNEARAEACVQSTTTFVESGPASHFPIVADWNEDGILDLAVANNVPSGTVAVLLGNGVAGVGDGSFGAPTFFNAGVKPAGLATADFDEDGILDLAVANNATPGSYSILLGQGTSGIGDGTFAAPVSYPVGALPLRILARDFNEDGITDLAIACSGSSSIAIALGIGANGVGTGTFAPASNLVVGSGPVDLVTGDWNENGVLDLAVIRNPTGSIVLLMGNGSGGRGNGTFSPGASYSGGSGGAAIATGDWNEDGIADLAVARRESPGSISVLRGGGSGGVGNGTFLPRVDVPSAPMPTSMLAGDFNGDGITDLALVNAESAGAAIVHPGLGLANVGNGSFEPAITRPIGALPTALAAGDFDEDGSPDLALTHSASSLNLAVLLAVCTGALAGDVTVTSPNGGESWPATTEQTISWTRGPAVQAVTIEVTRDGATWETIAEGVTGTSYPWTVTDPATGGALATVRVRDALVPTRADASDAPFTIAPNPLLDAPRGPAVVLALEGVFPNPASAALFVSFALPRAAPATLELVDVAGRRVLAREVGVLGAGRHVVDLGRGAALASGLYFVRLVQGDRRVVTRAAILR